MADRAYVQPKALIGVLRYINPNDEILIGTKVLDQTASPHIMLYYQIHLIQMDLLYGLLILAHNQEF